MANLNALNFVEPLTINEIAQSILHLGPQRTIYIKSEPGCGKSSLLKLLAEMNGDKWRAVGDVCPTDKYNYCYIDATNIDLGDLYMRAPDVAEKKLIQYLTDLVPNNGKPCVIMIDEHGKAPTKMMKQALTRLVLERCLGDWKLPKGSIVFSTSNNESDMLGDNLPAHSRNRIVEVPMRKPNDVIWLGWAAKNGIHPLTMAWLSCNKRALASYTDEGQADNPFIFHPARPDMQFVSPRSLETASDITKLRVRLSDDVISTLLAGAVGAAAAKSMVAMFTLDKEVIPTEQVIANPDTCAVPSKTAAVFMMMFNALDDLKTQDDMTAWLTYVDRIGSEEIFATFYMMAFKSPKIVRLAKGNKRMIDWAMKNSPMLL